MKKRVCKNSFFLLLYLHYYKSQFRLNAPSTKLETLNIT